jgi:hypothetical protein
MKQINSNPIRKQFAPVPLFLIAASIIMATTPSLSLHGNKFVDPKLGVPGAVLYFLNEALTDNIALKRTFSGYNKTHQKKYGNGTYTSTFKITSEVNPHTSESIYEWSRTYVEKLNGKNTKDVKSSSEFVPLIGEGSQSPEELEAQAEEEHTFPIKCRLEVRQYFCRTAPNFETRDTSAFKYRISWKYIPEGDVNLYWRRARHFQMTLSNWRNLGISCDKAYHGDGAVFSTRSAITEGSTLGGEIAAESYQSLFGVVNIDSYTSNCDIAFEAINKRP